MSSSAAVAELPGQSDSKPLQLAPVAGGDMLAEIARLEAASYPADEAASPESLAYRAKHAGDVFRVVTAPTAATPPTTKVIAFVCGTLTHADTLTHESMSKHEASGTTLCIHSVVVHPDHRRQGIAKHMLQAYLAQLPDFVTLVVLMCKPRLIPLYEQCGFKLIGVSPVVHGQSPWYEMRHECGGGHGTPPTDGGDTPAPATAENANVVQDGGAAGGAVAPEEGGGGGGVGGDGSAAPQIEAAARKKQKTKKANYDVATADAHSVPALAVFDLDACFWDEEMCVCGCVVGACVARACVRACVCACAPWFRSCVMRTLDQASRYMLPTSSESATSVRISAPIDRSIQRTNVACGWHVRGTNERVCNAMHACMRYTVVCVHVVVGWLVGGCVCQVHAE